MNVIRTQSQPERFYLNQNVIKMQQHYYYRTWPLFIQLFLEKHFPILKFEHLNFIFLFHISSCSQTLSFLSSAPHFRSSHFDNINWGTLSVWRKHLLAINHLKLQGPHKSYGYLSLLPLWLYSVLWSFLHIYIFQESRSTIASIFYIFINPGN